MQQEEFDIAKLFAGFLAGNLTEEERTALEDWKAASQENADLFGKICRGAHIRELNRMAGQYNREMAWKNIEGNFKTGRTAHFRRWMKWVAILVLPLGISFWYLRHIDKSGEEEKIAVESNIEPEQVKTMGMMPVLTLSNGQEIALERQSLNLEEEDGTRILLSEDGTIQYTKSVSKKSGDVYNTLTTPAQCDFMFTLEDGTKVWLNACSSLRYPVAFTGKERIVYAEGEIYLEVAKDTKRPFYVITGNDVKVQVLGTSFNVNTYRDVQVTLVSGKVQVEYKDGKKLWTLRPGYQLSMADGQGEVKEVNVEDYISWKDGIYIFKGEQLDVIAEVIERWFGKQVVFLDEQGKKEVFTGILDKHTGVEVFARQLSRTSGLQCAISGDQLFIKSNK